MAGRVLEQGAMSFKGDSRAGRLRNGRGVASKRRRRRSELALGLVLASFASMTACGASPAEESSKQPDGAGSNSLGAASPEVGAASPGAGTGPNGLGAAPAGAGAASPGVGAASPGAAGGSPGVGAGGSGGTSSSGAGSGSGAVGASTTDGVGGGGWGAALGGVTADAGNSGSSAGGPDAGAGEAGSGGAVGEPDAAGAGVAASSSGAAGGGGGLAPGEIGGSSGCLPFVMPDDCTIPSGAVLPSDLRCTGLYEDWETRTVACDVETYEPAYELWSDAAAKTRYASLPPGETIDATDPDDFVYPVGTRFWKEFFVGPPGEQRLGETRFLRKDELGWVYTSYVWSEDGSAAIQTNEGVDDLFGTGHSVPSREQCKACHSGRPDFVLGWDFVMLGPGATGVTRESLLGRGLLQGGDSEGDPSALTIPGDAVEQQALGYLHANCGISCHNETTNAEGRPSGLFLRLELAEMASPLTTDAVTSGINRLPSPNAELVGLPPSDVANYDFLPLDPARSLVVTRMDFRGSPTAMPPIGTHQVDETGLAIVTDWVNQMTPERGYPAPAP